MNPIDSHDLIKLKNGQFQVRSHKLPEFSKTLPNIEAAAEVLESLGVISDEIDVAIVSMVVQERNAAAFDATTGVFTFTENLV